MAHLVRIGNRGINLDQVTEWSMNVDMLVIYFAGPDSDQPKARFWGREALLLQEFLEEHSVLGVSTAGAEAAS